MFLWLQVFSVNAVMPVFAVIAVKLDRGFRESSEANVSYECSDASVVNDSSEASVFSESSDQKPVCSVKQ